MTIDPTNPKHFDAHEPDCPLCAASGGIPPAGVPVDEKLPDEMQRVLDGLPEDYLKMQGITREQMKEIALASLQQGREAPPSENLVDRAFRDLMLTMGPVSKRERADARRFFFCGAEAVYRMCTAAENAANVARAVEVGTALHREFRRWHAEDIKEIFAEFVAAAREAMLKDIKPANDKPV